MAPWKPPNSYFWDVIPNRTNRMPSSLRIFICVCIYIYIMCRRLVVGWVCLFSSFRFDCACVPAKLCASASRCCLRGWKYFDKMCSGGAWRGVWCGACPSLGWLFRSNNLLVSCLIRKATLTDAEVHHLACEYGISLFVGRF